jgi:hypothetical protein
MKTVKNILKYKNKTSFLGRLRKKLLYNLDFRFSDVVIAKHEISLESYKFLYRNLVKINKALKGIATLTISKAKYNGEFGYTLVVNLKVIR